MIPWLVLNRIKYREVQRKTDSQFPAAKWEQPSVPLTWRQGPEQGHTHASDRAVGHMGPQEVLTPYRSPGHPILTMGVYEIQPALHTAYDSPDTKSLNVLSELAPTTITPSSALASPRERNPIENQDTRLRLSLLLSKNLLIRRGNETTVREPGFKSQPDHQQAGGFVAFLCCLDCRGRVY